MLAGIELKFQGGKLITRMTNEIKKTELKTVSFVLIY